MKGARWRRVECEVHEGARADGEWWGEVKWSRRLGERALIK